jgi:hypothetical protein
MSAANEQNMMPFDPSQGRKDRIVSVIQVARMLHKRIKANKPVNFEYKEHMKFAWVPAKMCAFNYARQRYPEPKHIQKLLAKWNIICTTPLQARYCPKTNTYYIADGQQHGIAWVLMYGEDAEVPVYYTESEDENIESVQLLALNTDNEPMAQYFIHKQKCIMGDVTAVGIENTVVNAGCETAYKKSKAGVITHITDLNNAAEHYGLEALGQVLVKMRQYWPTERIFTATMLGFLKLREIMLQEDVYTDADFEDVLSAAANHFESSERLHLDIKDEFEKAYPTNYKGMGVREKIASGLINVYEKTYNKKLCNTPFVINMPMMQDHAVS